MKFGISIKPVQLSWQSTCLVSKRSPVRIRIQALFLLQYFINLKSCILIEGFILISRQSYLSIKYILERRQNNKTGFINSLYGFVNTILTVFVNLIQIFSEFIIAICITRIFLKYLKIYLCNRAFQFPEPLRKVFVVVRLGPLEFVDIKSFLFSTLFTFLLWRFLNWWLPIFTFDGLFLLNYRSFQLELGIINIFNLVIKDTEISN